MAKKAAEPKTKPLPADACSAGGAFIKALKKLQGNSKLLFRILDQFPVPIEIFAPCGTIIFMNQAGFEMNNIKNPDLLIGKYNVLEDPVCNDELGMREDIRRAFGGEAVLIKDFNAPIQDLVNRKVIEEKPFEKALMDLFMYPINEGSKLTFLVCVFLVKSIYQGSPDAVKAKEYIDSHWKEKFDLGSIAKSANISVRQLYKLFKQHTGMTPLEYYRKCKVSHIREMLADKNITVREAFEACGENSRGTYARIFRKITGMSPGACRKSI